MRTWAVIRVDAGLGDFAPAGMHHMVADVFMPGDLDPSAPTVVLTCLPGGAMSRRYFDLQPELPIVDPSDDGHDDVATYSMASYLAAQGIIVVLVDHPAVGDSDVPDDPYVLTPQVVAALDAHVTSAIIDDLRAGLLGGARVPLTDLRSVGCGHSMGAMLTAYVQAATGVHDALALLGFAGGGLIEHLSDDERTYANDPERFAAEAVELTRKRFGRPLSRSETGPSPFLLAVEVPEYAIAAITECGSNLLNICGLTSMVPGVSKPVLDAIDVPVFIGVGEFDITGPSHEIPSHFPASRDVTLFVCEQMGHNHNVAGARTVLWDRLLVWLRQIAAAPREELGAGPA